MKLDIIYEDNHLLVLHKPADLLTQVTNLSDDSLETMAKAYIKEKYKKPGDVFLHAIHRIDKPVSGVVVFARTSKALTRLNAEIRAKKVGKEYVALIEGNLSQDEAVLQHYLFHGEHRAEIVSNKAMGQLARLRYVTLQRNNASTLVRIHLETGRYHQIRAQFSAIGHPIVGDRKYGSVKSFANGKAIALHHEKFEIEHPVTKERMLFEAKLPDWV